MEPPAMSGQLAQPEWTLLYLSASAPKKASGPQGLTPPSCCPLPELPAHPAPSPASDSRWGSPALAPASREPPPWSVCLGCWEPGLNLRGWGWFSLPAAAFPEPYRKIQPVQSRNKIKYNSISPLLIKLNILASKGNP